MPYTPDATDVSQPADTGVKASTAASEFRTLKTYVRDVILAAINSNTTNKADKNNTVLTGTASIAAMNVSGAATFASTAAFSLNPTAPTPTAGDSSTKLATTEFVINTSLSTSLPGLPGGKGKEITSDGTQAKWSFSAGSCLGILKYCGV